MPIRTDIYPIAEAEKYLQALVNRTQEAFPKYFTTADVVIAYVNNFKNPKIAGLFLDVGNYCNNASETPPFTMLTMYVSVFEKLASMESSSVGSWVDFLDWVNRKDVDAEYKLVLRKGNFSDFSALMDSLHGRWSKEFADVTKTVNFLKDQMTPQEKYAMVTCIKYLQTVPDVPISKESGSLPANEAAIKEYVKKNSAKTVEVALPACFEPKEYWRCLTSQGYCCDKTQCPMLGDKEKLDKCFKETVKTVYEWRSLSIHDLKVPPLREPLVYGMRYKGKFVPVELAVTELKPVFEGFIKRFFDKYQVSSSKKRIVKL
jgi:hypothetical protein